LVNENVSKDESIKLSLKVNWLSQTGTNITN
jgi:hypothetical protein